jgi:hypothetical protein
MEEWQVNDESERIWKQAVMAWFKGLSQHLSGGTEKTYKNLNLDSLSLGWDFNLGPSEYEAGVLTAWLRHVVIPTEDLGIFKRER